MRKSTLLIITLTLSVAISYAFTGDKEEPRYKNLKILPKDISERRLDSIMKSFTAAMNVKCNFCHVRDTATKQFDYASDAKKHKLVTREMMEMTEKINEKYFGLDEIWKKPNVSLHVSCYTCHNGKPEPEIRPIGK